MKLVKPSHNMKKITINLLLITIICGINTGCNTWKINSRNYRQSVDTQSQALRKKRPIFFEQGRFKEAQNLQPILTIEAGTIQWQSIIFEEGDFRIWMPAGTITEAKEVIEIDTGNIKFKVFATHPESARFVLAYSDLLDGKNLGNQEKIITKLRDKIVNVTDFKINQDRPYNLGNYPGQEFSLKNDRETIKFRIYLIDKRLYIIGASEIEKNNQIPGAVETFLDSFQLQKH
ncbi:MAG: hypothetical protein WBA93_24525 [Microcoleaceae cyanobacterium]